jgi:hypothetical protein
MEISRMADSKKEEEDSLLGDEEKIPAWRGRKSPCLERKERRSK